MQNSTFVTECGVIALYYENADANTVADLFFETADADESTSKIKEISAKIANKIQEIIDHIKEFFEQLKRKHESAKIAAMLRGEASRANKLIKVNVRDKEVSKVIAQLFKLEQKAFVEARKQYDAFMSHKIDYDTYCKNVDDISDRFDDAVNKLQDANEDKKIINPHTNLGTYKLSEVTKRVAAVENAYNKIIIKMNADVIKEEERLKAQAQRDVVTPAASSATSKFSTLLSKINRKATIAIVSVAGIAAAAAFCAKHAKDTNSVKTESAEDYFSDILDDAFEESAENTISDDIFSDILGI